LVSEITNHKGLILDRLENPVGFRWFHFDAKNGFSINGKPTKLIGTNRHQDFYGKANALSDEIHRYDMKLLKEMGINFLRISHYPQDPAILEMCNKYGFITTLEIPFVDKAAENEAGKQNTVNMLKEAIRFNYNNPSIVAWNLGNETTMKEPEKLGKKYNQESIIWKDKKSFVLYNLEENSIELNFKKNGELNFDKETIKKAFSSLIRANKSQKNKKFSYAVESLKELRANSIGSYKYEKQLPLWLDIL
jgi:hypothetical protein